LKTKNDSYVVFARKWRPQTFEEVVGQEAVKRQLQNALSDQRIANAYLFAGPRGVGKTSVARILAKALNCREGITPKPCNKCEMCTAITQGSSMDVIEIDGASYTGVDDIRDLQEGINRASFAARKKVYIIDEVHMLSINAFNALLKTLEEPPPFVVFIFATTEFEKIPETIKSRCQVYHFERISTRDIIERLDLILSREKGVSIPKKEKPAILEAIAANSEGGMRDAEVALDQLISLSGGKLKFEHVTQLLGLVEFDLLTGMVRDLAVKDVKSLLERVAKMVGEGRNLERFVKTFQSFLRDLLVLKAGGDAGLTSYSGERLAEMDKLLEKISMPFLLNAMNNFLALEERMKTTPHVRFLLEFVLIKLTVVQSDVDIDAVLKRIEGMPVRSGPSAIPPVTGPAAPPPPRKPTVPDMFNGPARSLEPENPIEEVIAPAASGDHDEIWEQLKGHLLKKSPILSSVLDHCRIGGMEEGRLVIFFTDRYDEKTLSRPDNVAVIEEILSRLLNKTGRIVVKPAPRSVPAQSGEPEPCVPSESEEEKESLPTEEIGETLVEDKAEEEQSGIGELDVEKYRHLFQEKNVDRKFVLDLMKKNPDVKKAVDTIRKMLDARMSHFNDKPIS